LSAPDEKTGRDDARASLSLLRLVGWAAGLLAAAVAVGGACTLVGIISLSDLTPQIWASRALLMLTAGIVGASLAAGGLALQGLMRNPLAEPYILGISSGAGVGVMMGLAAAARWATPDSLTTDWAWMASTPVLAFLGATASCLAVYLVAQRRGRLDPYSLILSGVIVNIFNGAIMMVGNLYIDPHRIADLTYWAMGQLPDATPRSLLAVCGACVAAGWAVLLANSHAYNVLGLGDDVAASSGVSVNRLRLLTFGAVGVMTAAAVALAGPIGFLGLIVPHICRMAFGPDHRLGMIVTPLVGAIFLMVAETLCRSLGPALGLGRVPVGILTALAGGPFFIFLLRTRFRGAGA
jgi:iron complex transport system permease protein